MILILVNLKLYPATLVYLSLFWALVYLGYLRLTWAVVINYQVSNIDYRILIIQYGLSSSYYQILIFKYRLSSVIVYQLSPNERTHRGDAPTMQHNERTHTIHWAHIQLLYRSRYQVPSIKHQLSIIKYQVSSIKYLVPCIWYLVSSINYQESGCKQKQERAITNPNMNSYKTIKAIKTILGDLIVIRLVLNSKNENNPKYKDGLKNNDNLRSNLVFV